MTKTLADDGRRRVVIEAVSPAVDGGRFPIKRIDGDRVTVEADIFADGHDALRWEMAQVIPADPPSPSAVFERASLRIIMTYDSNDLRAG